MRFPRIVPLAAGVVLSVVGCEQSTGPSEEPPPEPGPPVIRSFGPLKSRLDHGEATNLVWRVDGANVASISGLGVVTPPGEGAFNIRPHETISYTLTVSNDHGTVEETTTIEVRYPAGIFVNSEGGDDEATGDSPATALRTLDAALGRVQGGGFIFLSKGTYRNEIVVENVDVDIYGGLDPVTFFEGPEPESNLTTIQASGGIPLTVRNTGSAIIEMTNVVFDAGSGGERAVSAENATVWFRSCTLDGRSSSAANAIRLLGGSDVQLVSCRVYGKKSLASLPNESSAIAVLDESSALISHCFVDGGRAQLLCTGIDVATSGVVRIGLCTIGAEITTAGTGNSAAAIRIREGHPKIGGNILFTRGSGAVRRLGVSEEAADTDPSGLQFNLFISLSSPPYRNFGGNDPITEADLNGKNGTRNPLESNPNETYQNIWERSVAAAELFPVGAIETGDFHLVSPLLSGGPNPAVDRGEAILSSPDYVLRDDAGRVFDIDGESRPPTHWDLGADERVF